MTPGLIKRIGHVALGTSELDAALDFYVRVANLTPGPPQPDGTAYLRCQAEHHALALRASAAPGLDHLGFETFSDEDTLACRRHLERLGIETAAAPEEPGRLGEAFRFRDPAGTSIEIYRAMALGPGVVSPGPFALNRLGHVTLLTPDLEAPARFYREALGFRVSDRAPHGVWLRCSADHHVLAFLAGGRTAFDHHAYEIPDWNELKRICDWCFRQGVPLDAGPMRHGPGNNVNVYVQGPDGVKIEFYAEMEQIRDSEDHVRARPRNAARYGNLWQFRPPAEPGGGA